MITRETDYAIRALLCLAQHGNGHVVSTTILAEEMDIPYRFLRRILLKLAEEGVVSSTRGKQGGLRLTRRPAEISLLDVVQAVDPETVTLNICLSDANNCPRSPRCVVHEELGVIQAELHARLAGVTLAMLVARDQARQQAGGTRPA